ncbi:MAG: hypothetical protein Q7T10_09535 [Rhodoferax sp.]|nr:hypothetical protein [Rhodoferax sp.]
MRVSSRDLTIETGQVLTRMLDTVGWGLFFIWAGIVFLANAGWGVGLLGTGVILLGAQGARGYFSLTVNRFGLMLGIFFAMAGIFRLLDIHLDKAPIPAWALPILLIVLGVAILASLWLHRPRD